MKLRFSVRATAFAAGFKVDIEEENSLDAANSVGEAAQIAQDLHRIDPQVVRDTIAKSCFTREAEAEFLGNSDDDHTLAVFDKTIRGKTDRFVFRFVRN